MKFSFFLSKKRRGWDDKMGSAPVFFGNPRHSIHGQQKRRPVADKILVLIKHVDLHSMLSFQVWRALQPSSTRSLHGMESFILDLYQKKSKLTRDPEENKPQIQIYPRPYTTTSHIKNSSTSCNFPTTSLGGHTGASGNTWILASLSNTGEVYRSSLHQMPCSFI